MKSQNKYKSVQLVLFILLTLGAGGIVFLDTEIFHMVANNMGVMVLCILLWVTLLLSFVFIYLDYSHFQTFKREYKEMDYLVHSDQVSGISNRFTCDRLIEQYLDRPLPPEMGCITFMLTNVGRINDQFGHRMGNTMIRDFATILNTTAQGVCFVGRNGGNNFLALFETCTEEALQSYLVLVKEKVKAYNDAQDNKAFQIGYAFGAAFQEGDSAQTITDLIAISNRRVASIKG